MTADAEMITTYLEMLAPQPMQATQPHRTGMLLRIGEPAAAFYRYLIAGMGGEVDEALDDEALGTRLLDDDYDVYVVYLGGVPAAMFELDRRSPPESELVEFGVLDGFSGRGLGAYVLESAVDTAWKHGPERVWVRATNQKDPRRILMLQRAGFVAYQTTRERSG
jgi:GNAT superfamily N-acetyltransferase